MKLEGTIPMSGLEKTLQEETERFQKRREGRDFTLSTFNAATNRCGRCRLDKPHIWALVQNPKLRFEEIDFSEATPPPMYENVCRDCLTNEELAELLRPVFYFLVNDSIRKLRSPENRGKEILGSLAHVQAWLSARDLPKPIETYREVALRALEGLKGVPPPDVDWNGLNRDLSNAIARNMFFAAHPDDLPNSVEEARKIDDKVGMFFRNGTSIEAYALRDSVAKCVEFFRRYFYRRVV